MEHWLILLGVLLPLAPLLQLAEGRLEKEPLPVPVESRRRSDRG